MHPPAPSRAIPALMLLVSLLAFGWVYSLYLDGHSVPAAAFIVPPVAALALGGLVDPRILWSVGPRRHEFPTRIRIAGAFVFALGIIGSAALLVLRPRF